MSPRPFAIKRARGVARLRAPISRADLDRRQVIVNACCHQDNLFSIHCVIGHACRGYQHSFAMTNAGVVRCALAKAGSTHSPLDDSLAEGRQHSGGWRFHRHITRMGLEIPPVPHMVGGDSIRCASYVTFGTLELSKRAVIALKAGFACRLVSHGVIIVRRAERAPWGAVEVVPAARQYHRCSQIRSPPSLPRGGTERVRLKMSGCGRACANCGE